MRSAVEVSGNRITQWPHWRLVAIQGALAVVGVLWFGYTTRMISAPAYVVAALVPFVWRTRWVAVVAWTVFFLSGASPVEIVFNFPIHGVRVGRAAYGLPNKRGMQRISSGDVVWMGCTVPAFRPTWVIKFR